MQTAVTPVPESERYQALDLLRGCAVLGILVMNIQLFAMPLAAYSNPTALGEPSMRDFVIWSTNHLWADQKFMTIFSLLFGAGVLLMTMRIAERGGRQALIHYRRMGWLLVFGLMHAYLLWNGDILVLYAICGLCIYPARRLAARTLLVLAVWAVLLTVAPLWLERFRFGPLEWVWRALTYGRAASMTRGAGPEPAPAEICGG